jgi:hypothetical protein
VFLAAALEVFTAGRIRTNDSSGCDSTRLYNFKTFSAFYNIHGSTATKKKLII